MTWISSEAERILGSNFLQTVTRADLFPGLEPVASRGWTAVDGAALLTSWYESYHGERSRFPELLDYEIAVNGRGIPDLDLVGEGEARVSLLLRRGLAFAWAALHQAHVDLPGTNLISYISAAPTLMDPGHFTGNVTFCSTRPGQPVHLDPAHVTTDLVVALSTKDCNHQLPKAQA